MKMAWLGENTFFYSNLIAWIVNNKMYFRWSPFFNFSKSLGSEDLIKQKPFDERVKFMRDKWQSMTRDEKKLFKKGNNLFQK
jgi:hypothetical protein